MRIFPEEVKKALKEDGELKTFNDALAKLSGEESFCALQFPKLKMITLKIMRVLLFKKEI